MARVSSISAKQHPQVGAIAEVKSVRSRGWFLIVMLAAIFTVCATISFMCLFQSFRNITNVLLEHSAAYDTMLNDLEIIKTENVLMEGSLQALKSMAIPLEARIIRKADKFDIIKVIHKLRAKLKQNSDISHELLKIRANVDFKLRDQIDTFHQEDINADSEIISSLTQIIAETTDSTTSDINFGNGTVNIKLALQQYLSSLITIKSTKEFYTEHDRKGRLTQASNALQTKDFPLALATLEAFKDLRLLSIIRMIEVRIKLDTILNDIILEVLEND